MTDRELLELAAKAAGVVPSLNLSGDPKGTYKHPPEPGIIKASTSGWNPLTDDGDALRLAVKLFFTVGVEHGFTEVLTCSGREITESHNGDALFATRRAIVRAAAEIGRDKE